MASPKSKRGTLIDELLQDCPEGCRSNEPWKSDHAAKTRRPAD
jgi:hypothetical protein